VFFGNSPLNKMDNHKNMPNTIIAYILMPTKTKNYKLMTSLKINAQLMD
jgi:hypothetical protein